MGLLWVCSGRSTGATAWLPAMARLRPASRCSPTVGELVQSGLLAPRSLRAGVGHNLSPGLVTPAAGRRRKRSPPDSKFGAPTPEEADAPCLLRTATGAPNAKGVACAVSLPAERLNGFISAIAARLQQAVEEVEALPAKVWVVLGLTVCAEDEVAQAIYRGGRGLPEVAGC